MIIKTFQSKHEHFISIAAFFSLSFDVFLCEFMRQMIHNPCRTCLQTLAMSNVFTVCVFFIRQSVLPEASILTVYFIATVQIDVV